LEKNCFGEVCTTSQGKYWPGKQAVLLVFSIIKTCLCLKPRPVPPKDGLVVSQSYKDTHSQHAHPKARSHNIREDRRVSLAPPIISQVTPSPAKPAFGHLPRCIAGWAVLRRRHSAIAINQLSLVSSLSRGSGEIGDAIILS
jgi:hypothetical protein